MVVSSGTRHGSVEEGRSRQHSHPRFEEDWQTVQFVVRRKFLVQAVEIIEFERRRTSLLPLSFLEKEADHIAPHIYIYILENCICYTEKTEMIES
jgi:hypothetical protein